MDGSVGGKAAVLDCAGVYAPAQKLQKAHMAHHAIASAAVIGDDCFPAFNESDGSQNLMRARLRQSRLRFASNVTIAFTIASYVLAPIPRRV